MGVQAERRTAAGGWLSIMAAAALAALGLSGAASAGPVQQLQDAERGFVQAVAQSGIAAGFRQFAAPDAVMFLPDPIPAGPALAAARWGGELVWRPQYVGVAPSGDLAFTLGPSLAKAGPRVSGGVYLSIWRRGLDGAWRWAVDHGVDMPPGVWSAPPQPVTILATEPPPGPPSAEGIREADGALNVALPRDAASAFAARIDEEGIVVRTNRPLAAGRRKALALAMEAPAIQEAHTMNGAVSTDGAFGYTYGRARWSTPTGPQLAYYVRVWRLTPQGWRLLVDHLAER